MNDVVDPFRFEPGYFEKMAAEIYHGVEAMSNSGAQKMLITPRHYKLMRTEKKKSTKAKDFGSVVHEGTLEPSTFTERVICISEDAPRRPTSVQLKAKKPAPETIEAIEYWRAFDATNRGKLVMTPGEYARAARCIAAAREHPAARRLLEAADAIESSLFWIDGEFGVPCKARLDLRVFGGVADLKTTVDASPLEFAKSIANYGYMTQGAHYFSGCEHVLDSTPEFFVMIAVESDEPHSVAVYQMPSNGILTGAHRMRVALKRYRDVLACDEWPGYPDTIEMIALPKWATTVDP